MTQTATSKLRSRYPLALRRCLPEATLYGRCVVQSVDLKAKECDKEFKSLSRCFQEAVRGLGSK